MNDKDMEDQDLNDKDIEDQGLDGEYMDDEYSAGRPEDSKAESSEEKPAMTTTSKCILSGWGLEPGPAHINTTTSRMDPSRFSTTSFTRLKAKCTYMSSHPNAKRKLKRTQSRSCTQASSLGIQGYQ